MLSFFHSNYVKKLIQTISFHKHKKDKNFSKNKHDISSFSDYTYND